MLNYIVAGGKCSDCSLGATCNFRDICALRYYRHDGGTCIQGISDIYIHCSFKGSPILGVLQKSENTIVGCRHGQFSQEISECINTNKTNSLGTAVPKCEGRWLKVIL